MSRNRKYVIVRFADHDCAMNAFDAFRKNFPSQLVASQDLSKVEESTVYIQEDSLNVSNGTARTFLQGCHGAIPVSG